MNLPFFLARKLYNGGDLGKKVSRPAVRIAMLGVAIGLAVVIISVSVVIGFKHTIRDKVVGFGSHITVANFKTLQTSHPAPIEIKDSMINVLSRIHGVKHVQRYAYIQGILKTDDDFLGVMFKGVDEGFDSTFIASNMVEGSVPAFSGEKSNNHILLSKTIADKLHATVGTKLYAYFLTGADNVRARRFTVSGIYQTNLARYDQNICFSDLYTVCKLNGWEANSVSGTELAINDFENLNDVEETIIQKVHHTADSKGETYCSATILEQSPQIFSWLDMLDMNVWIILILMVCVAGFTIVSGLLIIILERTSMIGVLKALGARNKLVRHTFINLALMIVSKGILWGNILGLGLFFLQKTTGIIKLDPATYYVDVVPLELPLLLWGIINIGTFVTCALVLVVPSFFVSNINPARSMRYE